MKTVVLGACRLVGGLLVAGVVLGISVPLVDEGMSAWSVWVVGIACVAMILYITRPGR